MAWFEKSAGDKKVPEVEPEKTSGALKPASAPTASTAAEPKPTVKVEEPPVSTAGLVGYLYKGSRVSGQLIFQGSVRIDGAVEGDIQCQGTLTIGESAEVKAKIMAKVVVIRGKVEGNVSAKEKIELIAPARLIGNIDSPRLIITEGVVFDGDCSMGAAKQMGGVAGTHNVVADVVAVAQGAKATS
jgi:cytoskeletal protein CcmA (bactofilin family)